MGVDSRFFLTREPLSLPAALELVGAEPVSAASVRRDAEPSVTGVASLGEAGPSEVVFVDRKAAVESARDAAFALCLTTRELAPSLGTGSLAAGCVAVAADPRAAFAMIADRLHGERPDAGEAGVSASARVAADARVHPLAVVGHDARIGERTTIAAHAAIGPGVEIGPDCTIGPCVTIRCALVGARAVIRAGARIGEAGFGFRKGPEGLLPAPQLGRVLIGDDVEIGANTTIDRGALGDTTVGDGTKIDNLVQVAHNVRIGRHCVLAAQVGIAGSTVIGEGSMLGGQVGLADHLKIGERVRIAAKAGVMSDIPAGETWGGFPARPMRRWLKEAAALKRVAQRHRE